MLDTVVTRLLAGDDGDVRVAARLLAARTERHRVGRRSIEAVVPRGSA